MKKLILSVVLLLVNQLFSQDNEKTVAVLACGQGKSYEEAKNNALRNALEQTYGVFISSKTELLNDDLIKDEIVSISNGAIRSFNEISNAIISNGDIAVSLKVIIAPTVIQELVKSKGYEISFSGNDLSNTIYLQKLNENSEELAMSNLVDASSKYLHNLYRYSIKSSSPKVIYYKNTTNYYGNSSIELDESFKSNLIDESNKIILEYKSNNDYYYYRRHSSEITDNLENELNEEYVSKDQKTQDFLYSIFEVSAFPSENLFTYFKYVISTLEGMSLDQNGIHDYFKIGKRIYPIYIKDLDGKDHYFYLRNYKASKMFWDLISEIDKRKKNFIVNNGIENLSINRSLLDELNLIQNEEIYNDNNFIDNENSLNNLSTKFNIDISLYKVNHSIADFIFFDVILDSELPLINKYVINDGLIYEGLVVNVKQSKEELKLKQQEEQRQKELQRQEEYRKQEEARREEIRKQEEARQEEYRKQEQARQEEYRKQQIENEKQRKKEKRRKAVNSVIAYSLLFGFLYLINIIYG